MSKKVKVNVSIEGTYRVQGTVEMTREQYEGLCERIDNARGFESEQIAEEVADLCKFDIGRDGDILDLEVDNFYEVGLKANAGIERQPQK